MTATADRRMAGPPQPADEDLRRVALGVAAAAFAVMAVSVWLPMLRSGLRHDENLTAWVTEGSLVDAISRSWTHQGQSPLYFVLLWLWRSLVGDAPWLLRLPTVVATLAAAWQLRRLGDELDRPGTGVIAAAVFVTSVSIADIATAARPYGLLLLSLIGGTRLGLRFTRDHRWTDGAGWVACAALALALQPLAAYAIAAQLVLLSPSERMPWRRVGWLAVLGAVLVAPLVPQVLDLSQRQSNLAIADVPTIRTAVFATVPTAAVLAWLAGLAVSRRVESWTPADDRCWPLALTWAIAVPAGLYAQSHLTGSSVFLDRYHVSVVPATALVAALALHRLVDGRALVAAAAVVLLLIATTVDPLRSHDWDGAVAAVHAGTADDALVLASTGYIEAGDAGVFADPGVGEYLAAPLTVHGLDRTVVGLPRHDEGLNGDYVDRVLDQAAASGADVALVEIVLGGQVDHRPVIAEALAPAGYRETDRSDLLGVRVTVYRRG